MQMKGTAGQGLTAFEDGTFLATTQIDTGAKEGHELSLVDTFQNQVVMPFKGIHRR